MDEHTLIFPRRNAVIECRPDGVYQDGVRISWSLGDLFLRTSPAWTRKSEVDHWYWASGTWQGDLYRGGPSPE